MRTITRLFYLRCSIFLGIFCSVTQFASAQLTDYVVYAGAGSTGSAAPPSPGFAVILASGTAINGGKIGSQVLINSTGSSTITGILQSGGKITLSNNNTIISGDVFAANSTSQTG